MCWACDHPGGNRLDYLDHLQEIIVRHKWAVQGIESDRIHPPWAYTAGLTLHGRPELVVTGLSLASAKGLLNDVAAHVLHATVPEPGERVKLAGGPLVEIVEVGEPTAHLEVAVALFGPRVRALQVVHADDRGRWPWERRYRGVQGGQPVLGRRASVAVGLLPLASDHGLPYIGRCRNLSQSTISGPIITRSGGTKPGMST
jgi:hypothetical protein